MVAFMNRFYMNEAAMVIPDGAIDRSMTHILLKTSSGVSVTFVVERLEFEAGQTLREAYRNYINDLGMRLSRFSPVFERETLVNGVPALEIGVNWRSEAGEAMYTRQVHLGLDASWRIFGIEGPRDLRLELDGLFAPIIESIELRTG